MQVFFETETDVDAFLHDELRQESCPACGKTGAFRRHGYISGWISRNTKGIRGWRICCRKDYGGCGIAPSIRVANSLRHRFFTAAELWAFLLSLLEGYSVKAAWEHSGIRLTLDAGYQVHKRLLRCISVLRTRLHGRGPPKKKKSAGDPLLQTIQDLKQTFADAKNAVRTYQAALQRDFLALT